jgi:hypothetical protein
MSILELIFGKKPSEKDIIAFNYKLYFDYLPKRLNVWKQNGETIQVILSFDELKQKNNIWKQLAKRIKIKSTTLKSYEDIIFYVIQAPSIKMIGLVEIAIFAINIRLDKYEYFTMEYSLGNYAICSIDQKGNHYYIDKCRDAESFGVYVVKETIANLQPFPSI